MLQGKTAVEPSGHPGAIDTKQAGISTTPTRHSTAIDKDPEKSKKGEGVPDTAKSQTTIDPKRPAVSLLSMSNFTRQPLTDAGTEVSSILKVHIHSRAIRSVERVVGAEFAL